MQQCIARILFLGIYCIITIGHPAMSAQEHSAAQAAEDTLGERSTSPAPDTMTNATVSADLDTSQGRIVDTVIVIPQLDFSGIRLADGLHALSRAHNLSMYVDSSVTGVVSLRLENVTLNDALNFIVKEYDLEWERTGDIIKVYASEKPPPEPDPLNIDYADGRLSVNLVGAPLQRLVDTIIDMTGMNIIVERSAAGIVSGKLTDLPLEKAIRTLFPANGFEIREVDGVYFVSQGATDRSQTARTSTLNISCERGLISMDVSNTPLSQVIASLTSQCGLSILVQTPLEGTIQATFKDRLPSEALTFLLLNTAYSFTEIGDIFFVGGRDAQDFFGTRLIRLKHLIATNVESLIPVSLSSQLTVKVAKEHNGLVVTGPSTALARLESFIEEIDIPTAQVLFDVLVVDYAFNQMSEFRLTANNYGGDDGLPGQTYWPEIDVSATGEQLNDNVASMARHLDISKPFVLDEDFFLRLRWMEREGIANVRSHPQIAALNGHKASISIGTTQYFLLESETVYPSTQQDFKQTAQRFEIIEADMRLEVTPHVNSERELIVEVNPEFSTPVGQLDPEIPPTINRRLLESTVRLHNGETIVLGGLVQVTESKNIDRLPILGDIPILGRLFQNRKTTNEKSELMIYITPHVYYGSEGSVSLDSVLKAD